MTIVVIIGFILFLVGMAVSVWAFGTGGKRANVFKDIYFETTNDTNLTNQYRPQIKQI